MHAYYPTIDHYAFLPFLPRPLPFLPLLSSILLYSYYPFCLALATCNNVTSCSASSHELGNGPESAEREERLLRDTHFMTHTLRPHMSAARAAPSLRTTRRAAALSSQELPSSAALAERPCPRNALLAQGACAVNRSSQIVLRVAFSRICGRDSLLFGTLALVVPWRPSAHSIGMPPTHQPGS